MSESTITEMPAPTTAQKPYARTGADRPRMVAATSSDQVPKSLLELDQWICWRYEMRDGKPTKFPVQTNGQLAATDDPTTWTNFEKALDATKRRPTLGVGFVFAKSGGIAGVDLDDCLDQLGHLKTWAQPIVERFGDTYCEVSPSGTGVKIFCRGNLEGVVTGTGTRRQYHDGQIEAYQHTRFFAVTGLAFNGAPLEIEEHQGDLRWLMTLIGVRPPAETGSKPPAPAAPTTELSPEEIEKLRAVLDAAQEADPKFKGLFRGDLWGFTSKNEADLSFCNQLAVLGLNADEIDAAVRISGRMRPKWDKRHFANGSTYGQATVRRALIPIAPTNIRGSTENSMPEVSPATNATNSEKARAALRQMLNLDIDRVKKHGRSGGDFVVHLHDGRTIDLGDAGALIAPRRVQQAIIDSLNIQPPKLSGEKWREVIDALLLLVEIVETEDDWLEVAVEEYVHQNGLTARCSEDIFGVYEESRKNRCPVVLPERGVVIISAQAFHTWMAVNRSWKVTFPELVKGLSKAGAKKLAAAASPTWEGKRVLLHRRWEITLPADFDYVDVRAPRCSHVFAPVRSAFAPN